MTPIILDTDKFRELLVGKRFDKLLDIIKNNKDESLRWDAVWIAGEITESIVKNDSLYSKIADLFVWVFKK